MYREPEKEGVKMQEQIYWVWLSQIKGLTIQDVEQLQKQYGTLQAIWEEDKVQNFQNYVRLPIAKQLEDQAYKTKVKHIVALMKERQVQLVHYQQADYPQMLKNIYAPPATLYLKGNKKLLNTKAIAVIGTRKASDYGKRVAKEMARGLVEQQWTVISGLAKGIDAKAHEGTVQAKGNTIAIVAGGVDYIYPKENATLYERILQNGGAILSENGIYTQPEKQDFPKRNRLVSGMAKGVLVVEAAQRSGSCITVDFALSQGKEVFAVPGNITSTQSQGTNMLIQEGAKCVTKVSDILEEWEP